MMKILYSLFALAIIGGIASSARAAENFVVREGALPASTLQIVDARPPKEIKGGLPLLFDPTYSIPDKRFTPPLLAVFAATLAEHSKSDLSGKKIVIEHLQVQNYFRGTYEKNQSMSLFITAGVVGAALAAIDGNKPVDAVRIKIAGTIEGAAFRVDLAESYEAGKFSGMVYNGPNAQAATKSLVQRGMDQAVVAVEAVR